MITNGHFDRLRRLALQTAGIELVERHRDLLFHRCRRLGIVDGDDLETFLCEVEAGDSTATQRLLFLLTTKFTGFFRHPQQFKVAAEHAARVAARAGRVRLWSAAAATGEEPYSLAMALIEIFGRDDPPVVILATDVEANALAAAELGEYSEAAIEALDPARRARFLVAGGGEGRCSISPAVRRLVTFRILNLAAADWPIEGPFDIILCRNALMYLATRLRLAALERMTSLLAPDGLLMIDPTEHLGGAETLFSPRADGVYSRSNATGPADGLPSMRTGKNP